MKHKQSKGIQGRIAELCALHDLEDGSGDALAAILESLAGEHAPTAVKEPRLGVDVHIADALTGLDCEEIRAAGVIADVGSGCGIPGLALAVGVPSSTLIAVEASARRCEFIQATALGAGLTNVEAVKARAEEWESGLGSCDVVVARAVAPMAVLAEYAAPLLKLGGTLVAWKGTPDRQEVAAGVAAGSLLGLESLDSIPVVPWPGGGRRQLLRMRKVADTPDGYPRRPGVAAKRPLGG